MTVQHSFSKIENELLHGFRKKMADAESTEDVKKFFAYTIQDLFGQVFAGSVDLEHNDITFKPDQEPPYILADWVQVSSIFLETWNTSDLSHVVSRFAESALHHYKHLRKNPAKTEAKMRK